MPIDVDWHGWSVNSMLPTGHQAVYLAVINLLLSFQDADGLFADTEIP